MTSPSVVGTIVKQTNWAAVSTVFAVCVAAFGFFSSIKSDIRDLATTLDAYHRDAESTDAKVDKLYDLFINETFSTLGTPRK